MRPLTIALLGTLMLAGSACADPEASLLVTGHTPLEGSLEDDGTITSCEVPDTIGDTTLVQSLFINLAQHDNVPFSLGLLMENQLADSSQYAPIGEDSNDRIDQNHIEIQGYELTFDSDDDGFNTLGSDGEVRYEATGIVPTDGVLWAEVVLFFPNEIDAWRNAFEIAAGGQSNAIVPTFAEVQVVGRTTGGEKVTSNRLTMPLQVCDGCARSSTPICVAVE